MLVVAWVLYLCVSCSEAPSRTGVEGAQSIPRIERVVVIHLDATRMDDIGCYGGLAETPAIDSVAARGIRFTNSIAPVPKTSPSAASFLTGRLANRNGVYECGQGLRDEYVTLPEILQEHGFITAGCVSNGNLFPLRKGTGKPTGFEQGFEVYKCFFWNGDPYEYLEGPKKPPPFDEQAAGPLWACDRVSKAAIEFIKQHPRERFFLWLFFLDPHDPYTPPEEYTRKYLDAPALLEVTQPVPRARRNRSKGANAVGHDMSHEYIARHLGEVSHTDHWVGEILKALDGLPGKTLCIITADHGENMGERNAWFSHGSNLHAAAVNVPLVMACDGVIPVRESEALVANVDLAVTILDLLGISSEPLDADGRSLWPTFHEEDPWPERIIPTQTRQGLPWRGARRGLYSLQIRAIPPRLKVMYDHRTDPDEQLDIVTAQPRVATALEAYVDEWFSPNRRQVPPVDLSNDPEMRERLEALGYL